MVPSFMVLSVPKCPMELLTHFPSLFQRRYSELPLIIYEEGSLVVAYPVALAPMFDQPAAAVVVVWNLLSPTTPNNTRLKQNRTGMNGNGKGSVVVYTGRWGSQSQESISKISDETVWQLPGNTRSRVSLAR